MFHQTLAHTITCCSYRFIILGESIVGGGGSGYNIGAKLICRGTGILGGNVGGGESDFYDGERPVGRVVIL